MNYQKALKILNNSKHEPALKLYTLVVLLHWAEHLVQAFQVYVMNWSIPDSRGVLGLWFPWLVTSEILHYGYALFMLAGLWILRSGFTGRSRLWWNISLAIQFWHHFEHLILQLQAFFGKNLFDSPIPMSIVQLWIPRVELHLIYNTLVFIPMVIGMYYHIFPNEDEKAHQNCGCAWNA